MCIQSATRKISMIILILILVFRLGRCRIGFAEAFSDHATQNADLYAIGNFDHQLGVIGHPGDRADKAAIGNDLVPPPQIGQRLAVFFGFLLLRANEEKVKYDENKHEWEKSPEAVEAAFWVMYPGLPDPVYAYLQQAGVHFTIEQRRASSVGACKAALDRTEQDHL